MQRGVRIALAGMGAVIVLIAVAFATVGTQLDDVRIERNDLQAEVGDLQAELSVARTQLSGFQTMLDEAQQTAQHAGDVQAQLQEARAQGETQANTIQQLNRELEQLRAKASTTAAGP